MNIASGFFKKLQQFSSKRSIPSFLKKNHLAMINDKSDK
jgi:hypothetical protein